MPTSKMYPFKSTYVTVMGCTVDISDNWGITKQKRALVYSPCWKAVTIVSLSKHFRVGAEFLLIQ